MAIATITEDKTFLSKIDEYSYPKAKIILKYKKVEVSQKLPFRVKFMNIGILGNYSPNNPAPIGIAIVGLNNYVL